MVATCSSTPAPSRRSPSGPPPIESCSSAAPLRPSAATSWRSTSSSAPAPRCRWAPPRRRWRGPGRPVAGRRRPSTPTVAAGGALRWEPEPLVAVAGCRHHATTTVALAADATAWLLDEVVLGRTGEPSGNVALDVARRAGGAGRAAPHRAARSRRAGVGERGDRRPAPSPVGGDRRWPTGSRRPAGRHVRRRRRRAGRRAGRLGRAGRRLVAPGGATGARRARSGLITPAARPRRGGGWPTRRRG